MRKKIQRISIFFGIFIILVLCGTFFFLRSETFLNWVETRLASELENQIANGYTADIDDIKGSIFGNVTIRGVKISKDSEPVISTTSVVLKYNWLGLLTRKFEVKELKVVEPEIHVKHDPDGTLNLSNILREDASSGEDSSSADAPQFGFAIGKVELGRGKIHYTDIQRDLEISVQGITLTLNGPLDAWNHSGDLSIEAGSFKFNGSETPIDRFEVDFEILATRSKFDIFRLDFGNSRVVAFGQFPYRSTGNYWSIDLDLQRLDLADVEQFFGKGTELESIVKGRITANGNLDSSFAATLSVETPTLSVTQAEHGRQIALTDLKIDADFNLHPTPTLTLKTFNAQIADGTLTGSGNIGLPNRPEGDVIAQLRQLTTHPLAYTGQWEATDVQLIPLLSMFVQLPEFLVGSTGYLSGNATFNGSSTDPSTLNLNSEIEVTETVLNTVALADSTLSCTIDAGEVKVDGNLDETEIDITGPFPLAEQETLDLRMSGINFDDLMKIVDSADL
ncbi:hypothetical protein F4Y19_10720, partial [Candidatus Poribacteria bacterium]|nr:hypothetical protein [Candidatus Poribacteria bacterium]